MFDESVRYIDEVPAMSALEKSEPHLALDTNDHPMIKHPIGQRYPNENNQDRTEDSASSLRTYPFFEELKCSKQNFAGNLFAKMRN